MKTEMIMSHLYGKSYGDVVKAISTEEDVGDCCGYAGIEINDHVAELERSECAVLVSVIKIDYGAVEDASRVVVNFIFDLGDRKGVILGYDLTAGSGSGWLYGAYCVLKYDGEEIAQASW